MDRSITLERIVALNELHMAWRINKLKPQSYARAVNPLPDHSGLAAYFPMQKLLKMAPSKSSGK